MDRASMITLDEALKLLALASPALPVGAFAYSQGLEAAVAVGWVRDEASTHLWLTDLLDQVWANYDAPMVAAMTEAARGAQMDGDTARLRILDERFAAARESAELFAESRQLGGALVRLLPQLGVCGWPSSIPEPCWPTVWAWVCAAWQLPRAAAVGGYLYAACENAVLAAVKLVPLGQAAGQRLLMDLRPRVVQVAERSSARPFGPIRSSAPALALVSSWHETLYTRLYRS